MRLEIPGMDALEISNLVLDYNGTVAFNGEVIEGVMQRIELLGKSLKIYVLTADTYGSVHAQCKGYPVTVQVITPERQDYQKRIFIDSLDAQTCIAMGNGKNDALMLSCAALGFAILQEEGISTQTLMASDVVFKSINDALDALIFPKRLIATLRN